MPSSDFSLEGKAAIVTGAGRGIGQAIALALATAGAVVTLGSRTEDELDETAEKIKALGRQATVVPTDVAKEEDAKRLVHRAVASFGKIDILVNAAGIGQGTVASEELRIEHWNQVLSTNLTGAWLCCQEAGRVMIPRRSGKIINIVSIFGKHPNAGTIAYNASKAGLEMVTKTLALEWGRYNIRVNAIAPGAVMTRMTEKKFTLPEIEQYWHDRVPLGRIAGPDEMAGAAVFLASDAANYVNGETITVDGGWLLT